MQCKFKAKKVNTGGRCHMKTKKGIVAPVLLSHDPSILFVNFYYLYMVHTPYTYTVVTVERANRRRNLFPDLHATSGSRTRHSRLHSGLKNRENQMNE